MKRTTLALAAALAFAGHAQADEALAKKHNCTACHKVDAKLVGPAYKDVAAKYKNDKKAEAALFDKVKKGSMGVWGPVPMPPNGAVPDEDIKKLVKWVLSVK
ncbi:MAG: c-type cytochrome [Betaproteobacteria bacterium]|nr:c-type cytochrome [Betaproteobacteria bacterium]